MSAHAYKAISTSITVVSLCLTMAFRWGCGGPFGSGLRSPVLAVRAAGTVTLTLSHRYSFEYDTSANYDGGQVRLSVNGGPFATVAPANFSANGYGGPIGGTIFGAISGSPGWINQAFVQESTGYTNRTFITSVATLGSNSWRVGMSAVKAASQTGKSIAFNWLVVTP